MSSVQFQLVFEALTGIDPSDSIALDDISFTSSCQFLNGSLPGFVSTQFPPVSTSSTKSPIICPPKTGYCAADRKCIPLDHYCNFRQDCSDGSDESGCTPSICTFEDEDPNRACNWKVFNFRFSKTLEDTRNFTWRIYRASKVPETPNKNLMPKDDVNSGADGHFAAVDAAFGKFRDRGHFRSPKIRQVGPRCGFAFWYYCNLRVCPLELLKLTEVADGQTETLIWDPFSQGMMNFLREIDVR